MSLAEKIRKAREQTVEQGGFTFTVRRPTDVEMMGLAGSGSVARILPYIIGWAGVREIDVLPGGDPHPLPFDAAVRDEWLADRPDLLMPLADRILESYRAHVSSLEAAAKN